MNWLKGHNEILNQFRADCPKCGTQLEDRTYLDADAGMYFFRTVFECQRDNWALMTRLDEFNSITEVGITQKETVMETPYAQMKLDMTVAMLRRLIADGV